MSKTLTRAMALWIVAAATMLGGVREASAAFTQGNIVILQVGDGSTTQTGGQVGGTTLPVQLLEFTTAGATGASVALPSSGTTSVTLQGAQAFGDGMLSLSGDGRYLIVHGYNVDAGNLSSINRIIARVDGDGTADLTTRFSMSANGVPKGAASFDGSRFWVSSGNATTPGLGTLALGGTTLMTVQNSSITLHPQVLGSQLYCYDGSAHSISITATALPSSASTLTNLTPIPTNNATSQTNFALLNRNGGAGFDTAYVADENGIEKFSSEDGGTTWTNRGSAAGPVAFANGAIFGIVAINNASNVDLYVTTGDGSITQNTLEKTTDSATFNADISLAAFSALATAPANNVFLGVAMAPTPAGPPKVLSINRNIPAGSATNSTSVNYTVTFDRSVTNVDKDDFALALTGVTTTPPLVVSGIGTTYTVTVNGITGNGTLGLNLNNNNTILDLAGNGLALNEVQRVDVAGSSGTFTLTFNGQPTTALAFDASAAQVQAALELLTTIGAGNVSVSKSGSKYTITFIGSLSQADQTQITATGSGGASVSVTTLIDGVSFTTFTGQVYTIDNIKPTLAIAAPSKTIAKNSDSVSYDVTFSDANLQSPALSAATIRNNLILNKTGSADASNISVVVAANVATITLSSLIGDGTLSITIGANSVTDLAGNANATSSASAAFTVDTTKPAVAISAPSLLVAKTGASVSYSVTFSDTNPKSPSLDSALITSSLLVTRTGSANAGSVLVNTSPGSNVATVTFNLLSGDGTIALTIGADSAFDLAGNTNASFGPSAAFTVDNTKPTVAISAPSKSCAKTGDSVSYTLTFADLNFQSPALDASIIKSLLTIAKTGTANSANISVTTSGNVATVTFDQLSGDGALSFTVGAASITDAGGNSNNLSSPSTAFTIDNTKPAVAISAPSKQYAKSGTSVAYSVTFSDANFKSPPLDAAAITSKLIITRSGSANAAKITVSTTPTFNVATVTFDQLSGDGSLSFVVGADCVFDLAGNSNAASTGSDSFTVDNTAPTIVIGPPSVANTMNGPCSYVVTYADNFALNITLSPGDISLNATGPANGTVTVSPGATANQRVVMLSSVTGFGSLGISIKAGTASDPAGNLAPAAGPATPFFVDTPPQVSVNFGSTSPKTLEKLVATALGTDAEKDPLKYTYIWKVNGSTVRTTSSTSAESDTLDLSIAGNGNKGDDITVAVTVNDGVVDGNTATATAKVVNSAPLATVIFNSVPNTNDTLSAAVKASDDDGDPVTLTYVWKVNGAIKKTTSATSALSDSFDLSIPGNGDSGDTILLEVTPNDGSVDGAVASASVVVGTPVFLSEPTVSPNPTFENLEASFSAVLDQNNLAVTWNFGDGTSAATGATPKHIYALAGNYTVTVTAANPSTGSKSSATLPLKVLPLDAKVPTSLPDTKALRVTQGTITLSSAKNVITFNGVIHLSDGEQINGSTMDIRVNGVSRSFKLSDKGVGNTADGSLSLRFKNVKGAVISQDASLKVTISGADIPTDIVKGVALDDAGLPKTVVVTIQFNGDALSDVVPVQFSNKNGKKSAKFGASK